jgi:hypothetical protein
MNAPVGYAARVSGVIFMPSQNIEWAYALAAAYAQRLEQQNHRVTDPKPISSSSTPATKESAGQAPLLGVGPSAIPGSIPRPIPQCSGTRARRNCRYVSAWAE